VWTALPTTTTTTTIRPLLSHPQDSFALPPGDTLMALEVPNLVFMSRASAADEQHQKGAAAIPRLKRRPMRDFVGLGAIACLRVAVGQSVSWLNACMDAQSINPPPQTESNNSGLILQLYCTFHT
jgi:hypothetical protein